MVTVTNNKASKKPPTKYPKITEKARRLGVSRQHLFCVLEGQRRSPVLLVRFRKLKLKGGTK